MKEDLHYLDTITIHAPDFDCDINGSCDGPASTDQKVPTVPASLPSTEYESTQYGELKPLSSNRITSEHIPLISFKHSPDQMQTKMQARVKDTTEYMGLDWQMEEDYVDNYKTDKHQTDTQKTKVNDTSNLYNSTTLMPDLECITHSRSENFPGL